ncbi:MAG: hydrogenase expression/formation C-terminal domain-containing protein [Paracoccaceae bacterium]|nr:hydrogenase expression/formation protein [Maritimibacter sp.]
MNAGERSSGQINSIRALRAHVPTGNAGPVLREIAAALARLLDTGETTTIDLGALPFSAGDEKTLDAALGTGELTARIEALGTSHVTETATPGVWRIDHFDQQGETLSRFVEITLVPDILKTQVPDAVEGLRRLDTYLASGDFD